MCIYFSEKLQRLIQLNQDLESVEVYNELLQFSITLEHSECSNLKTYVNQTAIYWFKLLKEKLQKYKDNLISLFIDFIAFSYNRDMQETLKLIQWPMISTNQEVLQTVPSSDVMNKFQTTFQCLWKLQMPPNLYKFYFIITFSIVLLIISFFFL